MSPAHVVLLAALVSAQPSAPPPRGATATTARPLSYDRPLTPADLAGRTLRELAIMRAYPRARAGMAVGDVWLSSYFWRLGFYGPALKNPTALSELGRAQIDAVDRHQAALPRAELEARWSRLIRHEHAASAYGPLAFSPDGQRLVSSRGGTSAIWEVGSGRLVRTLSIGYPGGLAFAADGRRLFEAGVDSFEILDTTTDKTISSSRTESFHEEFTGLAATGDLRFVLFFQGTPSKDDDTVPVRRLETATGKVSDLAVPDERFMAAALSPDGRVAHAMSESGGFYTFDLGTSKLLSRQPARAPVASKDGRFSRDARWALLPLPDGHLSVRETATGREAARLAPPAGETLGEAVVTDDGKAVYAGTRQGGLVQYAVAAPARPRVLRPPMTACRADLKVGPAEPQTLVLSPDGKHLAFYDGALGMWDLAAGRPAASWLGHTPLASEEDAVELLLLARALGKPVPVVAERLGKQRRE